MPVICFFLPCLEWLSFCRFLHCKSLMNLALMFSFVNQIHQVPSAPLYLSCSKIFCLYCFPLVEPETWHHLFWDLRTWLLLTLVRNPCPCFPVPLVPQGWAWGLGCFAAVWILCLLLFSSILPSDPFVALGAFHDLLLHTITLISWICLYQISSSRSLLTLFPVCKDHFGSQRSMLACLPALFPLHFFPGPFHWRTIQTLLEWTPVNFHLNASFSSK